MSAMNSKLLPKLIAAIVLPSIVSFCAYDLPQQALAQNSNQSRQGIPGRRVGGGTRSNSSLTLVALVPNNNQGLTASENPTLFFYVSQTPKPQMAEFVLMDENEQPVYETQFTTEGNSGLIGVNLAARKLKQPLEIGKVYRWYFAIVPDKSDRRTDIYVTGWIQKTQVNQQLDSQLKNATPLDRVALYKANNFWYDAIATLVELRKSRTLNPDVENKWAALLQSVNLDTIAQEPVVRDHPLMH